MAELSGSIVAGITIFDASGNVDKGATKYHGMNLLRNGASGIAAAILNGEGPALSDVQRSDVIDAYKSAIADYGSGHLIVGALRPTSDDVLFTLRGTNWGNVDAVLFSAPYEESLDDKGMAGLAEAAANVVPLADLILYNTGIADYQASFDGLQRMADATEGRLIGVKSTQPTNALTKEFQSKLSGSTSKSEFALYEGNDRLLLDTARDLEALREEGVYNFPTAHISGSGNYVPFLRAAQVVHKAFEAGNEQLAHDAQEYLRASFDVVLKNADQYAVRHTNGEPGIWKFLNAVAPFVTDSLRRITTGDGVRIAQSVKDLDFREQSLSLERRLT